MFLNCIIPYEGSIRYRLDLLDAQIWFEMFLMDFRAEQQRQWKDKDDIR